jgi:hypothetical protein
VRRVGEGCVRKIKRDTTSLRIHKLTASLKARSASTELSVGYLGQLRRHRNFLRGRFFALLLVVFDVA